MWIIGSKEITSYNNKRPGKPGFLQQEEKKYTEQGRIIPMLK